MKPPIPGERSREWLQRARSEEFRFVNPLPDANLIPGRRPPPQEDRFDVRKRMLGMETTLARKWER